MDMLEGVFFMQNLISVPVPMTSCRQEAYLQRLRRQFPFVYIRPLTRTAFGRRVWALQLGGGSRKVLVAAGHHANECITSDALWQWLFAYCEALLSGGALDGVPARELYHDTMVYLVPLANPDGADLIAGVCAADSPEYRAAAAIAAQYPEVPFPSGWKANLRGVDLNLNYPARWETARRIKKEQGVCTPAPRDFVGFSPLDQPESAALAAFARCVHPDLMLALHTQGSVIYSGPAESAPAGSAALAAAMSEASGYPVEPVPEASANAGFKDWFLQCFRRPAFTIEMGIGENPLPMTQLPALCRALRAIMTAALLW